MFHVSMPLHYRHKLIPTSDWILKSIPKVSRTLPYLIFVCLAYSYMRIVMVFIFHIIFYFLDMFDVTYLFVFLIPLLASLFQTLHSKERHPQ